MNWGFEPCRDAQVAAPSATSGAVARGLAPWQLELVLQHFRQDVSNEVDIAALACLCGLSRSYFIRAFKISTGLPPHRWLIRHRIECACELLERTNDSVAAISVTCGFADQSHLTRVFRELVGASPAAWRRQRKAIVAQRLRNGRTLAFE